VTPIVRPLKYYADGSVREKGIDVLIALDIAEGASNNDYDVAILMSADSDLAPPLERAIRHGKRVEVANWHSPTYESRLRVTGKSIWCHLLGVNRYQEVADSTDHAERSSRASNHRS
jgi:hypothetical protein